MANDSRPTLVHHPSTRHCRPSASQSTASTRKSGRLLSRSSPSWWPARETATSSLIPLWRRSTETRSVSSPSALPTCLPPSPRSEHGYPRGATSVSRATKYPRDVCRGHSHRGHTKCRSAPFAHAPTQTLAPPRDHGRLPHSSACMAFSGHGVQRGCRSSAASLAAGRRRSLCRR